MSGHWPSIHEPLINLFNKVKKQEEMQLDPLYYEHIFEGAKRAKSDFSLPNFEVIFCGYVAVRLFLTV